ncbi:hypothetical protein C789_4180 [Microcystis aeruginosa FACHB-905 = DIANCHI905]|uniref:Uncharacterized protein n=1 Tax=Microcystis aeruginosa PCC 7806SL TaxID=1903187 RepID=A0AB33C524_MICA7|nr:hypothetical protein BH695_4022 [Microcystis aeruginosa PCC 7806SL]ELS46023.1 hypothetical protein C789_4180 [Microcystis aeruginosa FACHB-905 = DIANCHI905]
MVWLGFAQASLIFDRQKLLLLNPTDKIGDRLSQKLLS